MMDSEQFVPRPSGSRLPWISAKSGKRRDIRDLVADDAAQFQGRDTSDLVTRDDSIGVFLQWDFRAMC